MLNTSVKKYIHESILCLLTTANSSNQPKTLPKKHFVARGSSERLVADIANIATTPQVSTAFMNTFTKKSYKINSSTKLISSVDESSEQLALPRQSATKMLPAPVSASDRDSRSKSHCRTRLSI